MNNKQCEYYRKSFLQKSLPELKLAFSINYSISSLLFQTASREVFLIVSNRCQESFSTKIFASHYQTAGETFCSCKGKCALLPCGCCYRPQQLRKGNVLHLSVILFTEIGVHPPGQTLPLPGRHPRADTPGRRAPYTSRADTPSPRRPLQRTIVDDSVLYILFA